MKRRRRGRREVAEISKFSEIPARYRPLLVLVPLFAVLVVAILIWGREPAALENKIDPHFSRVLPEEEVPELVTAAQLDKMSYLDSVMGEVGWTYTEESLSDLNRVLNEYEIKTPEEISQFLAQAAVETAAGRWLTELGDDAYFEKYGYTAGTRGAGYLHLTFGYGQMAFAVWMMKKEVPELSGLAYYNPTCHNEDEITEAYYAALRLAANLGIDISRYSRIVYDEQSPMETGADYIAQMFAWESAGYYWHITGIGRALSGRPGVWNTDEVSRLVGGGNWQSRREAYLAIYPVLSGGSEQD